MTLEQQVDALLAAVRQRLLEQRAAAGNRLAAVRAAAAGGALLEAVGQVAQHGASDTLIRDAAVEAAVAALALALVGDESGSYLLPGAEHEFVVLAMYEESGQPVLLARSPLGVFAVGQPLEADCNRWHFVRIPAGAAGAVMEGLLCPLAAARNHGRGPRLLGQGEVSAIGRVLRLHVDC